MFRLSITVCFCLLYSASFASSDDPVAYEKIEQSKIRKLLKKHQIFKKKDFNKLQETCSSPNDSSFHHHYMRFEVDQPIDEVWNAYMTLSPNKSWSGKHASFGVMYNGDNSDLEYSDVRSNNLREGQLFILQLKLFKGLLRMAVANKVTQVNHQEKNFQVCYINSGASEGNQNIQLSELPNGHTLIEHRSVFKSKSHFRDTKLYPRIHEKIIAEFHANVMASIPTAIASI